MHNNVSYCHVKQSKKPKRTEEGILFENNNISIPCNINDSLDLTAVHFFQYLVNRCLIIFNVKDVNAIYVRSYWDSSGGQLYASSS